MTSGLALGRHTRASACSRTHTHTHTSHGRDRVRTHAIGRSYRTSYFICKLCRKLMYTRKQLKHRREIRRKTMNEKFWTCSSLSLDISSCSCVCVCCRKFETHFICSFRSCKGHAIQKCCDSVCRQAVPSAEFPTKSTTHKMRWHSRLVNSSQKQSAISVSNCTNRSAGPTKRSTFDSYRKANRTNRQQELVAPEKVFLPKDDAKQRERTQ